MHLADASWGLSIFYTIDCQADKKEMLLCLFRYVKRDYVRGYKIATRRGFFFDRFSDVITASTVYGACDSLNE